MINLFCWRKPRTCRRCAYWLIPATSGLPRDAGYKRICIKTSNPLTRLAVPASLSSHDKFTSTGYEVLLTTAEYGCVQWRQKRD